MKGDKTHLRLRVSEDLDARTRTVEVLAVDGTVLGDLVGSVVDVTWKMGTNGNGGVGIVSIDVAAERALIESIEVPGLTTPWSVRRTRQDP